MPSCLDSVLSIFAENVGRSMDFCTRHDSLNLYAFFCVIHVGSLIVALSGICTPCLAPEMRGNLPGLKRAHVHTSYQIAPHQLVHVWHVSVLCNCKKNIKEVILLIRNSHADYIISCCLTDCSCSIFFRKLDQHPTPTSLTRLNQ